MSAQVENWTARQAAAEYDVYGKRGLTLVRGEGRHVFDEHGRRYLDCIAGHGALVLGHAHPAWLTALHAQASRLVACSGAFVNDARADYYQKLVAAAPSGLTRAFLCNSGSEAVEAALKFARQHSGRAEILAMSRAFHGRTLGALSATANASYRDPFLPLVPKFRHLPFDDASALEAAMSEQTAAVVLEIIQGEGGVHGASSDFLRAARTLCNRHGALLIFDEVQTGFGRSGELFACMRHAVTPDLLCLAKGIANGFPMGAVLVSEQFEPAVGTHGSTFGGNPLACALASATLRTLREEGLPERAAQAGHKLRSALEAARLPLVSEIRGEGLMLGIELRLRVRPILQDLAQRGVLALAAGSRVLRLLPPLNIQPHELDELAQTLVQALRMASGDEECAESA